MPKKKIYSRKQDDKPTSFYKKSVDESRQFREVHHESSPGPDPKQRINAFAREFRSLSKNLSDKKAASQISKMPTVTATDKGHQKFPPPPPSLSSPSSTVTAADKGQQKLPTSLSPSQSSVSSVF